MDLFPEYASLRNADNERITFRHLLTMTSGLKWDESLPYNNPANSELQMDDAADPIKYVLEQPVIAPPGSVYNYNGGNTTLLGAALAKVTGKRIDDYAKERLFGPLAITDFEWLPLPKTGQPAAASGLRMRPRDAAKLGQLMICGRRVERHPDPAQRLERRLDEAARQRRRTLLLRLSVVARPHHAPRTERALGGGRRLGWAATLRRARSRSRGDDQCRPLLGRAAAGRHPVRHLHQGRHPGGDGVIGPLR